MVMSTPILAEAARLLATTLIDTVQLGTVGDPVTAGASVTRSFTPTGDPVAGLVQSVTLESAVDGRVTQGWSVHVPHGTVLTAGMGVRVEVCVRQPSLVGRILLIDTASENGAAVIVKGTASSFVNVNQEGKGNIA